MVALVDAVKSGEIPDSEVVVVISDKADAAGLAKAAERGVETLVIERAGRKRAEHDAEIAAELKKRAVELVCLAGYMRLLSPEFIRTFPKSIVNIHPSLLPAFPGLDAQKQAIEKGARYSGCTVHFVDEGLDTGPIILQQWVPVEKGDTVESLSERILEVEHRLYVEAVRHLALEHNASERNPGRLAKYKTLKSVAHNLSHSFVSYMNYVDEGHVIDDIREIVRDKGRLSINWIGKTDQDPSLTPRIVESIKSYRPQLLRMVHASGALLSSIKEFRTDIYLLKNHQIAVDGILTDDRGRTYVTPVNDF